MKMGRPKLKKADQKAKTIGIRLKSDERSLVEKAAAKSKQGLSDWARNVLISSAQQQTGNTSL
jgi:uncharacterized protein (DUF1778 family)